MIQNEITFMINEVEKIVFKLDCSIDSINCCSEASIYFIKNNHQFLLDKDDSIRFNLECLVDIIMKALHNELILHKSIINDIGYDYNEYKQGKSGFTFEKDKGDDNELWVGYKYLLWGYEEVVWVYNDENLNIILEITPKFLNKISESSDLEKENVLIEIANSVLYEQWIKDYKPFLIRKIPRNVAQQWLDQANQILKQIEENIKRMRSERKF